MKDLSPGEAIPEYDLQQHDVMPTQNMIFIELVDINTSWNYMNRKLPWLKKTQSHLANHIIYQ